MTNAHQWIISQIGSRQHYGVPRGFENMGQLKRLYTDAWCPKPLRRILRYGNGSIRAFGTRWHVEIPDNKVLCQNILAVRHAIRRARTRATTVEQIYFDHLVIGNEFDNFVADDLARAGRIDPATDAFFGFNTACLRTLRLMRQRGVATVLDQIDPAKVEEDIVHSEVAKWPGWQSSSGRAPGEYWDHLAAEWAAADLILVNSNWSKTALVQQGVSASKIFVVAVAYEPEAAPARMNRRLNDGPLSVLWLGSVILRKGIPYLFEAARLLADTNLQFVVAGPIGISKDALAAAPANMRFIGRVTRDQTDKVYQQADIFVLPTISDGFAVTQVEAMSKGLPVITTPNCGEVVTNGVDGLIVPAGDAKALAEAIAKLDGDRRLLAEMSHNAFLRSTQFSLGAQTRQVETAVTEFVQGNRGHGRTVS
jgi:glycosyltransferase involved in cell wall biosynthesis